MSHIVLLASARRSCPSSQEISSAAHRARIVQSSTFRPHGLGLNFIHIFGHRLLGMSSIHKPFADNVGDHAATGEN